MTSRAPSNADLNLMPPPPLNTTLGQSCFAHRKALLWNNLPTAAADTLEQAARSYEACRKD